MTKDYIYIKLCSNDSLNLSNLKVTLINKCNKIVFDGITDNFGRVGRILIASMAIIHSCIFSPPLISSLREIIKGIL